MTDVMKKAFTWSVVSMTILWSVGFSAFVPLIAQAAECPALEAGDLMKAQTGSAVYILNSDLEASYFPNREVYGTWRADFSGLTVLSADCFENYPPAEHGVTVLPGTYLVTRVETPRVYVVLPGNVAQPIGNAEVAEALYGANWASRVRDVFTFNWRDYNVSADVLDEAVPHEGMFVKTADSSDVYRVVDGAYAMVDGDLGPWTQFVNTVSSAVFNTLEISGDTITPAEIVEDPTQGATSSDSSGDNGDDTPVVGPTGAVTFSLSASTPDTETVPGGSLGVPYLRFNVKAGNSAAQVNTITVRLGGVGDRTDFDKVYLYNGNTRVDTGRTLNTDDEVTFNVNMTIDAGDTESLEVRADHNTVAGTATAGNENYFQIRNVDAVDANGSVSGSFPIRGNVLVMGSQDVGTVTVTAAGSNATAEIGEDDVLIGQFDVAASSADDVQVAMMRLQNKGSADTSALSNIHLLVNGSEVAEGVLAGDDYIDFEFEDLLTIESGDTEGFKVYADVGIADTSDTFQLILDEVNDFEIYSDDFDGFRAGVTNTSLDSSGTGGSTAAITITLEGGAINVDWDGTSEDVRIDQNNVVFGTFTMQATAEDLDIDQMNFDLTKNANGDKCLEDLRLRDKNGRGSYSLTAVTACTTSATASEYKVEDLILSQGVTYEWELIADIASDADADDQYTWTWAASEVTGEGVSSDNTITSDDFSSASLTSPSLTVAASTLTVRSSALTDDTVVNGTDDVLFFKGEFEASSVSDVTLTSLTVQDQNTTAWDNLIDQLSLYIGNDVDPSVDSPIDVDTTVDSEEAIFNDIDYVIPAGSSNRVKFWIYGDITDGSTTGTVDVKIVDGDADDEDDEDVTLVNSSGTAITSSNVTTDRDITVAGTGSLTVVVDTDLAALENDQYVLAGTDRALVGMLELQATNEDVQLRDLVLNVSSTGSTTSSIETTFDSFSIYDSAALTNALATVDATKGDVTFEDVNYTVQDGKTQYLYIGAEVNPVSNEGSGTALPDTFVKFRGEDTGTTARGVSSKGDLAASDVTVTEGTFTNETRVIGVAISASTSFADGVLTGGQKTFFTFQVTADANGNETTSTGDVLSAHITQMNLQLSTDVGTASSENVSGIQLCRRDVSRCISLNTVGTLSDTTTTVSLQTGSDGYVDVTDFTTASDEYIDSGETVTFELKATFSNVTDKFAQGSVQNLDSSGIVWGYDTDDDGTDEYSHTDLRLQPRPSDYPDVIGGALN